MNNLTPFSWGVSESEWKKRKGLTYDDALKARKLLAPTPNPGSQEAIDKGCICPVMDNEYGRGYMGIKGLFVWTEGCKIHSWKREKK